jgi:hypothetical protein
MPYWQADDAHCFSGVSNLLSTGFAWSQDFARIFVYAQRETAARSWRPISCDGAPVAKIKRGTFFAVSVAPGRHVLSDEKGIPGFVNVRAGDESFVRLDWQIEIGEPATLVLSNVRPDLARKEMRFLSYIEAKEVLSRSVSNVDPRASPELHLKSRDENQ